MLSGPSFGWVNYKAFSAEVNAHMNAYGGENRFWLGPEGGKFSLFFKPDSEMVIKNWKTPPPIDTESWHVVSKSESFGDSAERYAPAELQGHGFDP